MTLLWLRRHFSGLLFHSVTVGTVDFYGRHFAPSEKMLCHSSHCSRCHCLLFFLCLQSHPPASLIFFSFFVTALTSFDRSDLNPKHRSHTAEDRAGRQRRWRPRAGQRESGRSREQSGERCQQQCQSCEDNNLLAGPIFGWNNMRTEGFKVNIPDRMVFLRAEGNTRRCFFSHVSNTTPHTIGRFYSPLHIEIIQQDHEIFYRRSWLPHDKIYRLWRPLTSPLHSTTLWFGRELL